MSDDNGGYLSDLAHDIIDYNGLSNVCINPCFYILFIIVLLISYDCVSNFIIVMMLYFVYRRCFSSFSLE